MKLRSLITFGFSLLAVTPSYAAITLTVPNNVELLLIDNQEVELDRSFLSASSTIELDNGEHQMVFRYKPVFKQGKDNIIVSSDIIVSKFSTSDTTLHFSFPSYNSPEKAKKFNDELNWELKNTDNHAIPYEQTQLIHHGVQVGRNIQFELAEFNTTEHPAAYKKGMVTVTHKEIKKEQGKNTNEQMLHYWYEKADKETKERFKQFILNE